MYRVTIAAPQIAAGKPDEKRRQTRRVLSTRRLVKVSQTVRYINREYGYQGLTRGAFLLKNQFDGLHSLAAAEFGQTIAYRTDHNRKKLMSMSVLVHGVRSD